MRSRLGLTAMGLAVAASIVLVGGIVAGRATAAEKAAPANSLMAEAKGVFAKLPAKMPGSEKDTPAKIALGKKLYIPRSLS